MKTRNTQWLLTLLTCLAAEACARADAPSPPQNVQPAWIHAWPANYARVTWDASPGAQSYHVYRLNDSTSAWEIIGTALTNRVFLDLTAGAPEKSYYVVATSPDGDSEASAMVTTHDNELIPQFIHSPPDAWSGTLTATSAVISWVSSLVSGSDAMLEIGPSLMDLAVVGFNPAYSFGASFTVTNLTPMTQYYYRITSVGPNRAGTTVTFWFTTPDVNHPPIADSQSFGPVVDPWPITFTLTGTDPDWPSNPLEFRIVSAPTNGMLSEIYYYYYSGPRLIDYTPNPGARGEDQFQFVVNDGQLDSAPATVTLTNIWLNRAPQLVTASTNTWEDTPLSLRLQATDPDGDPVTISADGCLHGSLIVTGAPPHVVYTPELNYVGSDLIFLTAWDGYSWGYAQAVIPVEVGAVNDAPIAQSPGSPLPTAEDTSVAITLVGSDVEGDALTFSVSGPSHGTLSGTPPAVTYHPAPNYHGPDSFTFQVNDGQADSAPATVEFTVSAVNDAPVAQASGTPLPMLEDGALPVTLVGSDVEGDALTFSIVAGPSHGTLSGTPPAVTYSPTPNYHGPDSFTFQVNDGQAVSAPAAVGFTVSAVNDAPVAESSGPLPMLEDDSLPVTLVGSDVEGDALTFSVVSGPSHGSLSGTLPAVTYHPAPNYYGPDSFTFKVNDGQADSAPATVSFIVSAVNDAPVAQASGPLPMLEDGSLPVTLVGSDVEGDALTFSVVSGPSHGTLSGTLPAVTYHPTPNYYGPDSFTFKVNDGQADSAPATVSFTVSAVNDAPLAQASGPLPMLEDGSLPVTLVGSDVEGDALTFSIVAGPSHGTLSGTAPAVTYHPAPNYYGPDNFTFKVNDGQADSAPAAVSFTVSPVNDAPVANAQFVATPYNTAINIVLSGSDVEGSALGFLVLTSPAHGTLSGTAPALTFTPTVGWSGATSFNFRVSDGLTNSAPATVNITVAAPTGIPAAPSGLTATAVSRTQINLAWNDNSNNEDGFKIERSTSANSGYAQIGTVGPGVTQYSSTGLSANKLYYYRVRAFNVLGNSPYSNKASARTLK